MLGALLGSISNPPTPKSVTHLHKHNDKGFPGVPGHPHAQTCSLEALTGDTSLQGTS